MTLNIDDLGTVWEALFDTRSKAYNIGLKLKVPVGTLDSIVKQYSDPSDQLREILKAWLKMAAQQKWQTIVEMLRSRIISEPKLASDIKAEYCKGTPGQRSGQAMPRDTQVQQLEQKLQEKQYVIEARERKQQKSTRQQEMDQLRKKLQEQQHPNEDEQRQQRELKEHLQRPATQSQPNPEQKPTQIKQISQGYSKAPEAMNRGSTATDGTTIYFNSEGSTSVHQYHSDSQQWSPQPDLPHPCSALVMADSKLTGVGGHLGLGEATNSLFSLMGEDWSKRWSRHFPPMATERYDTAAICHGRSLIVAGGDDGRNRLTTVEVLNMDTQCWSTASSLPHPFSNADTSIIGERLYMLGGSDQTGWTQSVLTCSISKLLHSCQTLSESTIWQRVTIARRVLPFVDSWLLWEGKMKLTRRLQPSSPTMNVPTPGKPWKP